MAKKKPELPWFKPRTKSTWMCPKGHLNRKTAIACTTCR